MNRLQESMQKYRLTEDDDSRTEMYSALLQADFYVPLNGQTENASFYVLKNSSEERYLLAFSSLDLLRSYFANQSESAALSFDQICSVLEIEEDLCGVVMDPQEGNMVFEKDLFAVLKEISRENPSVS